MRWLAKLKKSRQPPHQPASLEVSSRIGVVPLDISTELDPNVGPEDVDNGGCSRISQEDKGRNQQSRALDVSTLTRPGDSEDVTSVRIHEPERAPEAASNVLDKYLNQIVPDLSLNERGPEARNRPQPEDRRGAAKRPAHIRSEHVSSGGPTDKGAPDTARPEKSKEAERVSTPVEEATRGFGPLKSVLSSINIYYQGTLIGNKIEDLISRIVAIEKRFDSRPSDVAELRCRSEVIQLDDVKNEFHLLYERLESKELTTDLQDDEDAFTLLGSVRATIFDYQMEQQRKAYNHGCKLINSAEANILNNLRCAQEAEFRHGDRNGCLKGTREAVLDEIELWTRNFTEPSVYWLNGLAGTGKTTIIQTIAERVFADGQLGASFFCSRDFEDRSNLRLIFPTLAVQLARKYSDFRSLFVPLIQSDPGIAHESLYNQMHTLIVQPLKESDISTVIVLDALDECRDEEPASAILSVLGHFVSEIPRVKFLLAGRPEPRILEGFRLPLLAKATDVFVLHEVEPNQVDNDIRLFFSYKFSEIVRRRRGLDDWPTKEQLDILRKRAAGLFVYAVATVKFVDKPIGNPRRQLDLLIQSPESSVREGRAKLKTDTTLDSLYTSILKGAFGDEDDPDDDPKIRSVLGAMILAANPLSPSSIAVILGLDAADVFPLLSSTRSLLILQEDVNCPVQPFHKSFPDFITDSNRCTNTRFHVSPSNHHPQLLVGCLDLMNRTLEKNMCRLPEGVANSDVGDLKERIGRYIEPALRYACRSWHTHLVDERTPSATFGEITSALHRFLEKKFLFWLEVLSVLGDVRNAIDALQVAMCWLKEPLTLVLAEDCHRFVAGYFEIICASSPHIYHSALVLAPKTSIVRKLYESHSQHFARIVHGVPESWDSSTAAITFPYTLGTAAWSLCNTFIAICPWDTVSVDILDPVTLQRLQRLGLPSETLACFPALIFSSDTRRLTYSGHSAYRPEPNAPQVNVYREVLVVTWDLQTGGVVSSIRRKRSEEGSEAPRITYSTDGKMVAVLSQRRTGGAIISVFDVVAGVCMHEVDCRQLDHLGLHHIWTHEESIRFATAKPTMITIWEIGFTPGVPTTEVQTLPGPDDVKYATYFQFFPASRRAVFVSSTRILVWDAWDSKYLLHQKNIDPRSPIAFSSDGCFLACSTAGSGVYLWKESPTGYILHGRLSSSDQPLFSPNGISIVTLDHSMVRLWNTSNFTPIPSNTLIPAPQQTGKFILDFLPDRSSAVVVRQKDNRVIVFDLKSGAPRLTIKTPMEVYGLGVTEATIVTMGCKKVLTWLVPKVNPFLDVMLDIENSAQVVQLRDISSDAPRGDTVVASMSLNFYYIALMRDFGSGQLCLYSRSTGKYLHRTAITQPGTLWFAPDGDIWCTVGINRAEVLKITRNKLVPKMFLDDIEDEIQRCPWGSSHGYKITNDGWILGLGGKRLLMLPPSWQSNATQRVWNGQFLALLHATLPQPVIIELGP